VIRPVGDESARASRIHRPKLAELVAEELRRMILTPLPPGERLPSEAELAARFGTSTPTVRQALRVLESEGLVTMRRGVNGGPVVRRPLIDDVARTVGVFMQLEGVSQQELFEARRMLEAEATRRLAGAPSEHLLHQLTSSLEDYRRSIDIDEAATAAEHARFHHLLLDLSGNRAVRILGEMTRSIISGLADSSIEVLHHHHPELGWRDAAREALEAHRQIVDRISAHDVDGAYARVQQHLDRWIELVPITHGAAAVQVVHPLATPPLAPTGALPRTGWARSE
jgi:DNA-binding FadR family transcriptional regulator